MKKTILSCLLILAAATIAIGIFKVTIPTVLFVGIALLCPLMHVFMMHGMTKNSSHKH